MPAATGGLAVILKTSLSIVIATRNAAGEIASCLAALETQVHPGIEVLVAEGSRHLDARSLEPRYPWVQLVRGEACPGLAELRALALAQARGEIVAFTDVYCRVNPDWVQRLHREPWHTYAAVGGVVAPLPRRRLADWAAFLCEYGPYLPMPAGGQVDHVPGNNVAFRRQALERAGLVGEREFWKVFALQRLAARGERFWADPWLIVHHDRVMRPISFTYHRYLHGRCFGANRAAEMRWPRRLAHAAGCPFVPLLLTARLVGTVHRQQEYRRRLWQSLPFSVLFHTAWAWGEAHGYLRGRGEACTQLA